MRSNAAALQGSNSGVIWQISGVSGFSDDILLYEEFWLVQRVLLPAV